MKLRHTSLEYLVKHVGAIRMWLTHLDFAPNQASATT